MQEKARWFAQEKLKSEKVIHERQDVNKEVMTDLKETIEIEEKEHKRIEAYNKRHE